MKFCNFCSPLNLAALFLVFTAIFTIPSNEANAQGVVKSTHGAWSIFCETPPGASFEQCGMLQNVVADDREEMGLSVVILRTADRKSLFLRILTPLGILLPPGLGLYIDEKDIGNAYFTRCFNDGCYAEVVLVDKLLEQFKSGKSATFIIFETPEEGIGLPVDLTGFSEAFAKIP